jgi:TolB protein
MVRTDGQNSRQGPHRRAISLVRGIVTFLLGWAWPLKAAVPQVVLNAGGSAQVVMVCAQPEFAGSDDQGLGKSFLDVAYWDLVHSGAVVPLLEATLPSQGPLSHLAMRQAGATLLMRARLKRSWTQKLILKVEVTDLGAESLVFRKAYSCEEKSLPRAVHRLVDDLIGALTGTPGVANSRIIFVHEMAQGRKELFQVDPDGRNLTRITHHESLTLSPSITGDGRLAYVTYVSGLPHIWGQRQVRDAFQCLFPMNASTTAMAFTPAWSPDGKRLAMVLPNHLGDSDLAVLSLDKAKSYQVTGNSGINTEPAWSPTGHQIAFTSDRDGAPQIYLMETDGSNVRRLTLEGNYNASPSWSPDGGMLAYVSRMDGRFNLFVYKLAEGKAYQITRGSVSSESPSWSPDGRWIAFASDQDGKRQLFVTDLSGTTQRKVLELQGCQSPLWTRTR